MELFKGKKGTKEEEKAEDFNVLGANALAHAQIRLGQELQGSAEMNQIINEKVVKPMKKYLLKELTGQ